MDIPADRPLGRPKMSTFDPGDPKHSSAANQFVCRIDTLINASSATQRSIATKLGYSKSNIISMFKTGVTRVPADKVERLAVLLGADPVELLHLWYEAYEPHMVPIIERHFGDFLSASEKQHLTQLRRNHPNGLPAVAASAIEGRASR